MKKVRSTTQVTNTEQDVPRKIRVFKQPTGGNYSTTSASFVNMGPSTTYTAGPVDETVEMTINILMIVQTAGGIYVQPSLNGTRLNGGMYNEIGNSWMQATRTWLFDLDANQSATITLDWYVSGGGTASVSRSISDHTPNIIFESYPRQA